MANLSGAGAPQKDTVGVVGDIYTDTLTDTDYKLTAIILVKSEEGDYLEYTWIKQVSLGGEGVPGPQGPKGDKGDKGDTGATGPAGADGADGEDGGYYTPAVDTSGNLSWTGSKEGMTAVPSVNIKGPKGDTGATGPKGDTGATGPAGAPGDPSSLMVTGSYQGDDQNVRTISLGFKPRAVILNNEDYTAVASIDSSAGAKPIIVITDTGFEVRVGSKNMNAAASRYCYIAYK